MNLLPNSGMFFETSAYLIKKLNIRLIFLLTGFVLSSSVFAQDPHPKPTANFELSNLCYGSVTNFSNTSTSEEILQYTWTIWQQGIATPIYTSTATDIIFQFPAKTTYTVALSVIYYITPTHWHADETSRTIYVDSFPIANFSLKECHSRFTDLSNCCTNYYWDFGDGTTSTQKSPYHSYPSSNSYTVTLIAGNGTQSDTAVMVITPYANLLSGVFDMWVDGDSVRFKSQTDILKAAYVDWEWDFGDGSDLDIYGVDGWEVSHYYERLERDTSYVITLHEGDECFEKESQQIVFIKGTGKDISGTTLFPNPVSTPYLSIQTQNKEQILEIKLLDCLGQFLKIETRPYWYGYLVYMDNFAKGLYTVQLIFSDHTENHKIIKE